MRSVARYFRLLGALARYSLAREMAFRGNFLAKLAVEILWLGILLIFYRTVFAQTSVVAGWTEAEYLFFVGCYYTLGGIIETFFLGNCAGFSDLIRSGDLDHYLLKPIDEQFLLTCWDIDWSTASNVLLGSAVMALALGQMDGWVFRPGQALIFVLMLLCGTAIAYSFLVMLMSTAVWMVRNQSLFELWWLFSSLMRYPREIFTQSWAQPIGWFFTFIIPVMVVANVPARVMVKRVLDPSSEEFDPAIILFTAAATVALLVVSRKFFRFALRRYRSASS
ncbi:MAG TPA: ABC-2 family transporter protein [Gemmataceae bacterium]|jgi:ABC-2 type transport system permease protein|nr:ABC-2 family transporter protein [Gemmataceae bacterium]